MDCFDDRWDFYEEAVMFGEWAARYLGLFDDYWHESLVVRYHERSVIWSDMMPWGRMGEEWTRLRWRIYVRVIGEEAWEEFDIVAVNVTMEGSLAEVEWRPKRCLMEDLGGRQQVVSPDLEDRNYLLLSRWAHGGHI